MEQGEREGMGGREGERERVGKECWEWADADRQEEGEIDLGHIWLSGSGL